ncbi:MotA/TolQ/ExbB proton channel family protein [Bacteroidota bacterium]
MENLMTVVFYSLLQSLLLLLIVLFLFTKELINSKYPEKTKSLISSLAWFAVAWGFLGRTVGLIRAFDTIQAAGELTPWMLSHGLKMALVDPFMGILVFAIARIEIIILTIVQKK